MKAGSNGYIKINLNVDVNDVESVIFTLKGATTIRKAYPDRVTAVEGSFLIPLEQSETLELAGAYGSRVEVEAQINYNTGSVSKSNISTIMMDKSLGTKIVPNGQAVEIDLKDATLTSDGQIVFVGRNGRDGRDGADGRDGRDGKDGKNGLNGRDGSDGKSAYEIAVEKFGFEGTESEWLESLKGKEVSPELIAENVEKYLEENPVEYDDTEIKAEMGKISEEISDKIDDLAMSSFNIFISQPTDEEMSVDDYEFTTDKYISAADGTEIKSTNAYTLKWKATIGDRYRIHIPDLCVIALFNGTSRIEFQLRMFEIVADKEDMIIGIRKNNWGWLGNNPQMSIRHVTRRSLEMGYDYIVASHDATEYEKKMADLVCDGVNDEIELNCAINSNISIKKSCRVLLLGHDFIIDNFVNYKDLGYYYGLYLVQTLFVDSRNVNGVPYSDIFVSSKFKAHSDYMVDAPTIRISENAYNMIDGTITKEYAIIGAPRYKGNGHAGAQFNRYALEVDGINFIVYDRDKPCTCIDGVGMGQLRVSDCTCTWDYVKSGMNEDYLIKLDTNPACEGLIGIRGTHGSNRGKGNYIKRCRIVGMNEGIALTGEHFIVEDCVEHHCTYGFTVGNYDVCGKMEHPNIFIGNSVEQCVNFALFNRDGAKSESTASKPSMTFIYIGGSTESTWENSEGQNVTMNKMKEVVKGAYRGRIETDWRSDRALFEDGSGEHIKVTTYHSNGSSDR